MKPLRVDIRDAARVQQMVVVRGAIRQNRCADQQRPEILFLARRIFRQWMERGCEHCASRYFLLHPALRTANDPAKKGSHQHSTSGRR